MGFSYAIVALLAIAFVMDFALHKYVFPQTMPEPIKTEPKEEPTTEPETLPEEKENEIPSEEIPENATHDLEETPEEVTSTPNITQTKRKGNFKYINVHVKLWY